MGRVGGGEVQCDSVTIHVTFICCSLPEGNSMSKVLESDSTPFFVVICPSYQIGTFYSHSF